MERRGGRNRNHVKMVGWKTWICFKQSFLLPTKCFLLKLTSHSRHKSKGNGHGLVSLYKDMESCGEYEDIRVMWEIIHSCQQNANNTTRRRKRSSSYWIFCLQPHKLCPSFSKDLAFG